MQQPNTASQGAGTDRSKVPSHIKLNTQGSQQQVPPRPSPSQTAAQARVSQTMARQAQATQGRLVPQPQFQPQPQPQSQPQFFQQQQQAQPAVPQQAQEQVQAQAAAQQTPETNPPQAKVGGLGDASGAATAILAKAKEVFGVHSGYARHPRNSVIWRWWRPLLTSPLSVVYFILILLAMMVACMVTGLIPLETISAMSDMATEMPQSELFFSPFGAVLMIGGLATMTLALACALWTSRERPFGTVMSVFGGIRPMMFLRALPFAFVSLAIPMAIEVLLNGGFGQMRLLEVEPWILVLLVVLLPLQCLAEEVVFRGYVMQTLASWLPKRMFVIALVGQAFLFTIGHSYDLPGQIAIMFTGLMYGWLAEKTGGLEVGAAFHTANNTLAFALMFTGLANISTGASVLESVIDATATVLMPTLFVMWGMRSGWIDDPATKEAGEGPCRMFSSQSDDLMWERIQEQQLADWDRFMSEMPTVGPDQTGAIALMSNPEQYVDGEATVVGIGEGQYDDQIVGFADAVASPGARPAYARPQLPQPQQAYPQTAAYPTQPAQPVPQPVAYQPQAVPQPVAQPAQAWQAVPAPQPTEQPVAQTMPQPVQQAVPQTVAQTVASVPQAAAQAPRPVAPSVPEQGLAGDGSIPGDVGDNGAYVPSSPVPDLSSLL